jgi:hypothetical protein
VNYTYETYIVEKSKYGTYSSTASTLSHHNQTIQSILSILSKPINSNPINQVNQRFKNLQPKSHSQPQPQPQPHITNRLSNRKPKSKSNQINMPIAPKSFWPALAAFVSTFLPSPFHRPRRNTEKLTCLTSTVLHIHSSQRTERGQYYRCGSHTVAAADEAWAICYVWGCVVGGEWEVIGTTTFRDL